MRTPAESRSRWGGASGLEVPPTYLLCSRSQYSQTRSLFLVTTPRKSRAKLGPRTTQKESHQRYRGFLEYSSQPGKTTACLQRQRVSEPLLHLPFEQPCPAFSPIHRCLPSRPRDLSLAGPPPADSSPDGGPCRGSSERKTLSRVTSDGRPRRRTLVKAHPDGRPRRHTLVKAHQDGRP